MKIFYPFIIIIFFINSLSAQTPVANFTVDYASGCGSVITTFTNTSTNTISSTSYIWNFGDNTPTVPSLDAVHAFTNPGNYTVTLKVTNNNLTSTKTTTISVFKNPTALFKSDTTKGCFPLTVNFTDISILGSGKINQWTWSFGDGGGASIQNPSHIYNNSGSYDVSLQVIDENNCKGYITTAGLIKTFSKPNPNFTANKNYFCTPSSTPVCFTNTTSGNNLTYVWNFGNGVNSYANDTCVSYNNQSGFFNVSLTAINNNVCSNTITKNKFIEINTFKPDFKPNATKICDGSSVAFTYQLSANTTDKAISWSYNFGDNGNAKIENASHTYTNPGTYTVALIVNSANGCTDTVTYKNLITVNPNPTVNFSANITKACNAPLTVKFTDLSSSAKSWSWNFGDNAANAVTNPATHTYQSSGIFDVNLKITDNNGCSDSLTKKSFIKIQSPKAHFGSDVSEGCAPLNVHFTDQSTIGFPLKKWKWYFGYNNNTDNTPSTTTFIYPDTGVFNVSLVVIDSLGCKDSVTIPSYIMVGEKTPVAFYAYQNTIKDSVICFDTQIQFIIDTTSSKLWKYVDTWNWNFGQTEGTSNQQDPLHVFKTDTGHFTITLITLTHGCADTIIKTNYINVLSPRPIFYAMDSITNMSDTIGCRYPFTAVFKNYSQGADTTYWDFGDTTSIVKTTNQKYITHTYLKPDFYNVKLTTINIANNCRDSLIKTDPTFGGYIKVAQIIPGFTQNKSSICEYKSITFKDKSITNTSITKWEWNLGNGFDTITALDTIVHQYNTYGIASIMFTVTDRLGCDSTILKFFNDTIHKLPSPRFQADKTDGCKPLKVNFTDSSIQADAQITKWDWNFGDGTPATSVQNPQHTYQIRGNYTVKLTITDTLGCDSTLIKTNYIKPTFPYPSFKYDSIICRYNTLNITDASTGIQLKYKWNFGDGDSSSVQNPSHQYHNVDTTKFFNITLTLTDTNKCDSTIVKKIKVSQPNTAFAATLTRATCPPLFTKFYTINSSKDINTLKWNFGNGSPIVSTNPGDTASTIYAIPGNYSISLFAINTDNCIDTVKSDTTNSIFLDGPYGTFTSTALSRCLPASVSFKANAVKATSFEWIFQDGQAATTLADSTSHMYFQGGAYKPTLRLNDSITHCYVDITSANSFIVISGDVRIQTRPNTACNFPATIEFTDSTIVRPDTNIIKVTRTWDFGDGTVLSSAADTVHTYTNSGIYKITLTVKADSCEFPTQVKYFTISQKPNISFINLDSIGCSPLKVRFKIIDSTFNDTIKNWSWNFDDGSPADNSKNPTHAFSDTVKNNYNIVVSSILDNGCVYAYPETKKLTVFPTPVVKIKVDHDTIQQRSSITFMGESTGLVKKWLWNFGDSTISDQQNIIHNYQSVNDYPVTLQVTSVDLCVSSDTMTVFIITLKEIPNAFTPDGDGINDIFMKNVDLTILNRWGQILYQGRNGWDGYYKGQPVSPGTYFYIIYLEDIKGQSVKYTGPVTLIRK